MKLTILSLCAYFCAFCLVARAGEPRIPGFNYLIVIDPAVEENGRPAAVINGDQVEIPPTLHIHPYFYSGDVEYQAQILEGGPTIIVANHPKSGEKLYIDAILPPGAPVVAYRDDAIRYIYPDKRVIIEFVGIRNRHAVVKYVNGQGVVRSAQAKIAARKVKIKEQKGKSKLYSEIKEVSHDTGNIIKGSFGVVTTAGAFTLERVRVVAEMIPGVQPLMSLGEQAAERGAKEEVRQAGLKAAREQTEFIPTVR